MQEVRFPQHRKTACSGFFLPNIPTHYTQPFYAVAISTIETI